MRNSWPEFPILKNKDTSLLLAIKSKTHYHFFKGSFRENIAFIIQSH